jgi:AcrR family transcriptional regulator
MRKPPPSQRATGAGRRPGADSSGRERLLDAAIRLFAEHGISETTVAQIAEAGQVTSAMVHYWFDRRERLLDALAAERLAPVIRRIWDQSEAERGDAVLAVRGLVTRMLDVTEEMPWLPSLWLREIVQEGGLLRERVMEHLPRDRIGAFRRTVADAQARGLIDPDIAADLLFNSLMALVMLPLATARTWRRVNPEVVVDRPRLERHVMGLAMRGLTAATPVRAPRPVRRAK